MRTFLLLLGSLGIAGPAVYAQSTAPPAAAAASVPLSAVQRAAALELLVAMQMEQQLNNQVELILASQKDTQERLTAQSPELKDNLAAVQANMRQFYQKAMGWESMKEDIIQAYGSTFTTEELHSLTTFYRSKTGQMLVRKQPEAARLISAATQRRMMVLMPEMQRMMRGRLQQHAPADAAPKAPGN